MRWLLVGIVVIALGVGAYFLTTKKPAATELVAVRRGDVVELLVASGQVRAKRHSDLGLDIAGVIHAVHVDEGATVKAGMPLLELASTQTESEIEALRTAVVTAKLELEQARTRVRDADLDRQRLEVRRTEAVLRQAREDLARATSLGESDVVSTSAIDQAKRESEEAEALHLLAQKDLELLVLEPRAEELAVLTARIAEREAQLHVTEEKLARHVLYAPYDGIVTARLAEPGQSIAGGEVLLRLADPTTLQVYVETDENNLGKVALGQSATIITPTNTASSFSATLSHIQSRVDSDRGLVGLELLTSEMPDWVRIDMTVDMNLEVARLFNTLSIPVEALVLRRNETFVYTVRDGALVETPIRVLARGKRSIAIEGLEEGTLIARIGSNVKAGQAVVVPGAGDNAP